MLLTRGERRVLRALVEGSALRHRSELDGRKEHVLEHLEGSPSPVPAFTVALLEARGFVWSNQKFPLSTYVLTERGERAAAHLSEAPLRPLVARRA